MIDLIKSQMENCLVETVNYDSNMFIMEKSKQDSYVEALKQDSYASRFIDFLAEIQNGLHPEFIDKQYRIPKVRVREYLGIKSSGNFSNKVLNKSEVILYCQARDINLSGQYIRLPYAG